MNRWLALFIAIDLLLAFQLAGPKPTTRRVEAPRERASVVTEDKSVVSIDFTDSGCTGFVVAKGVVMTAAHCIHGKHVLAAVTFEDLRSSRPTRIAVLAEPDKHPERDLALLFTETYDIPPLKIGEMYPMESDIDLAHIQPGLSIGYGMEGSQKAVLCMGALEDRRHLLAFYGKIDHGDSGGPVLDIEGKVIGVQVRLGAGKDAPIFFAVSPTVMKEFLKKEGVEQ